MVLKGFAVKPFPVQHRPQSLISRSHLKKEQCDLTFSNGITPFPHIFPPAANGLVESTGHFQSLTFQKCVPTRKTSKPKPPTCGDPGLPTLALQELSLGKVLAKHTNHQASLIYLILKWSLLEIFHNYMDFPAHSNFVLFH